MSNERVVGIDLGTTNSLVAFMHSESPVIIPGEDGLNLVPSLVALDLNLISSSAMPRENTLLRLPSAPFTRSSA